MTVLDVLVELEERVAALEARARDLQEDGELAARDDIEQCTNPDADINASLVAQYMVSAERAQRQRDEALADLAALRTAVADARTLIAKIAEPRTGFLNRLLEEDRELATDVLARLDGAA